MNDIYSPRTGEHIETDDPAEWMLHAGIAAPAYNKQTAGCYWRGGVWVVEQATPAPTPTKQQRKDALIAAAGAKDVLSVWAFILGIEAKYAPMTPADLYATGNIAYCKCVDLKNALDAIDAEP